MEEKLLRKKIYAMGYKEGLEVGNEASKMNVSEDYLDDFFDDVVIKGFLESRFFSYDILPELRAISRQVFDDNELIDIYVNGIYEGFKEKYYKKEKSSIVPKYKFL